MVNDTRDLIENRLHYFIHKENQKSQDNTIKMKNVIITGVTGMVGGIVLEKCLHPEEIDKVIFISRKPARIANLKLHEIIHIDFMN
jgi:hypothetical protein